jgi:RND superfamily putative drug exporter
LPSSYESAKATKLGEEHFGQIEGATTVTGLVQRADQRVLTAADRANAAALVRGMTSWRADWDEVKKESGALLITKKQKEARALEPRIFAVAGGGRNELVAVQFKGNAADPTAHEAFKQFRTRTIDAFSAKQLQIGFTGGIAEQADIADSASTRQKIEGFLLFGSILLFSVVFFRGVLSTILPLLLICSWSSGSASGCAAASLARPQPMTQQPGSRLSSHPQRWRSWSRSRPSDSPSSASSACSVPRLRSRYS